MKMPSASGPIELCVSVSPIILDMIHLDSYGVSLLLDAATPDGLNEWDRLEAWLRGGESCLPGIVRPLRVNLISPLAARNSRSEFACKSVSLAGNLHRILSELEGELAQLGS
jgi:hypothetical protein